ncbi:MAG: hypothetical protein AMXMBFR13_46750 [Phycisphaerae bacterium]
MTADLKPYPEYSESGLPWLGRIPAHWEVRRNGRLFAQRNATGYGNLPILEVSLKTGVRVRDMDDLKRKQVMSDREKYKRAVKGDIAYNMMRMWQGAVGVAPEDGLVSPAYVVARPYPEAEPRYFSYLFRTDAYKNEVDGFSRGIVKDRNRLYWEDFKRMPSCFPPPDEQEPIADYLDANAVKVRRFIRNRRRLIEVLNEQKQAIINRAVTRGLDPNVRLKPSGIDWLGDIPEHWEVKKLRFMAESQGGMTPSKAEESFWNGSVPWVTPKDMKRAEIADSIDHITDAALNRTNIQLIEPPVVLIVVRGMILARTLPVAVTTTPVTINQDLKALMLQPCIDPTYMHNLLIGMAHGVRLLVEESGHGTRVLRTDLWRNMPLPLPPINEQKRINAAVARDSAKVEIAISKAQAEINLIREYRMRLVADVVTGKADVRQTSAAVTKEPAKRTANIHFRRSVFAAEIVHRLHAEPTFGHVKCQKLVFLCEKRCGADTGSTYHRQAAGPYDNRALRSIDSQIKKQKWYEVQKGDKGYRYVPLENAGAHKEYFERYFGDVADRFDEIIDVFRTARTVQCEIVATLYAAWEDLLAQGNVTDDQIIEQVLHNWHPSKQKIDENRWRRAIEWMRTKGITPESGHTQALIS